MRNFLNILSFKTDPKQMHFKYVNYFLVFYIAYNISIAFVAGNVLSKNFNLWILAFLTAAISFGLTLDDIIAEVYGIKNSAIFYFFMVLTRIMIAGFLYTFYRDFSVTKYLIFVALYHPIIYSFSWYLNVFVITKLKILTQGKYFWLRSIGSSGITITIFCLFVIIEDAKFSNWSMHQILLDDFISSYTLRIFFVVIFSIPANFIVNILKIIENNPTNEIVFNPFKNQIAVTDNEMHHETSYK